MRLSELRTGEKGVIVKVMGRGAFRKRIIEMGFIRGKEVEVIQNAPLKDPIHYRVMGYDVSLRRNDAQMIEVVSVAEFIEASTGKQENRPVDSYIQTSGKSLQAMAMHKGKTINVALVGNPNCGKTSLFNFASGAHEHVGNYSGVTVDAKAGTFHQNGYTFKIVDLPGTYSLSAYTPEELYVRKHLNEEQPDIVINVVDASNLERNLYLTCQLIDMDVRMVIALNMYDELERHGNKFDHNSLSRMIGTPIVPTISKTGFGIEELFNRVIKVYEEEDPVLRHIHINYGDVLEKAIYPVRHALKLNGNVSKSLSKRYLAIKLLEGDPEVESKRYAEYICKTIVGPVMCLAISVCRFVCAGRHDDLSPAFGCRGAGKGTPFHHPREHAAPGDGQGRDRTARCAGLVGSRKTLLRCDRTGLRRHRRFENRFRPQPRCQTYGCLL